MSPLCATPQSADEALVKLRAASYVLLDCEGKALGSTVGALSTISLGTPHAEHIYTFDALALPRASLQDVLVLITTPAPMKIVWDARMAASELSHAFGASMADVVDLAVADVVSRARRGEGERERIRRLASRTLPESQVLALQTADIHSLCGMGRALHEHGINPLEADTCQWLSVSWLVPSIARLLN